MVRFQTQAHSRVRQHNVFSSCYHPPAVAEAERCPACGAVRGKGSQQHKPTARPHLQVGRDLCPEGSNMCITHRDATHRAVGKQPALYNTYSMTHTKSEYKKKTTRSHVANKNHLAQRAGGDGPRTEEFLALLFVSHLKRTAWGGCWLRVNCFQIASDFPMYRNKRS